MSNITQSTYHAIQDARHDGLAVVERGRADLRRWDAQYSRTEITMDRHSAARDVTLDAIGKVEDALAASPVSPVDVERACLLVEASIDTLDTLASKAVKAVRS